jgi:hypothetical protein
MKHTPINISVFAIFRISPNAIFNLFKMIALLFKEIRRRLYSNTIFYIIRRDLTVHVDMFVPKIKLKLRELRKDDVPKFINIYEQRLTNREILDRIRILRMINSGIQTPYVVVTNDDQPCHLAWLIDSRENEKLKSFFNGTITPLADNEVLYELVFTLEKYRGLNIQVWRSLIFVEKSVAMGARWAIGYIRSTNEISLKNARKNAFEPYAIRTDKWRIFRCKTNFEVLSPEDPDSIDVK